MTVLIVSLHVLVAALLIGVVLLQRGQGADMGVSFGGGSAQTLFGSRGSGSFLGKLTGALAALFMLTSLSLSFLSKQESGSVVENAVRHQPAPTPPKPAGGGLDASKLKQAAPEDKLPGAQ